jgi:hypothetical protein
MDEVCFLDYRVLGKLDLFKTIVTYKLKKNMSAFSAFNFLLARGKLIGRKMRNLYIICHGTSGSVELGREEINIYTVSHWIQIRDAVDNIFVYACMAAHTGRGKKGTIADGRRLMSLLARTTNANVYASDTSQLYDPNGIALKKWEGRVYRFNPNGRIQQVQEAQVRTLTGKI